jgi:hypothetical protein
VQTVAYIELVDYVVGVILTPAPVSVRESDRAVKMPERIKAMGSGRLPQRFEWLSHQAQQSGAAAAASRGTGGTARD